MDHTLELRILVESAWMPADSLLADPSPLLAYYGERGQGISCCDLQGGFSIAVGGKTWMDQSTVDEFFMTATWVPAVLKLLQGSGQASVWAWEESDLTLNRVGDEVEMADVTSNGSVVLPRVRVSLRELAVSILREGSKLKRLVDLLRQHYTDLGMPVPDALAESLPEDYGAQLESLCELLDKV